MEQLPEAARARMEEIRASGTWGSALTTNEFAAVRAAGFEPVGQVLGSCVYHLGYAGSYSCPGAWMGGAGYTQTTTSRGYYAAYGPMVQALYDARRRALERMSTECQLLGGDGVVGVRLAIRRFPAGGIEFTAIGTAVRAAGSRIRPRSPFTSHVTGQEFAKLVLNGWIPVSLVLGIAIGTRHDDWWTRMASRRWAGNQEVAGYTDLVNRTRHESRVELKRHVEAAHADGVVVSSIDLEIRERECPVTDGQRDHICEATAIGTAIVAFTSSAQPPRPGALAIMSLDPERRAAARRETSVRYL
ncbi:MAG: heavy metal-binding domain-containing protein [Catenulispora sp.]|nr:heavy metal-binding domain-containing protein [Catenulispora sp.]